MSVPLLSLSHKLSKKQIENLDVTKIIKFKIYISRRILMDLVRQNSAKNPEWKILHVRQENPWPNQLRKLDQLKDDFTTVE